VRAAVVGADRRFEVVSVPDPAPGPGELLLRVTACGLCGSDVKARDAMPAGTIMGHEFASGRIDPSPLLTRTVDLARVDEAFDDLTRVAAGAKILVQP
jgi:threonine dehydrogenase-like Zn-dependent dehydrogenase